MANSRAFLKQSDLTRYAKAMKNAGVSEFRVEVEPTGKIIIIAGKTAVEASRNDWDGA
ncbi:hypothetical protein [Frigidibacter mobilis]|uniref:Uncharacterized protein n=1 Tax=Frigidibacter mobilis TaxID=1335048 RepID=A0A159Z381_9RHOB|nr:hypothetical protein [Frigidibacter mobilis]AMY68590.1 hypothetical protein AKL17_1335 [Frigidibacter mobilis]